MRLFLILLVVGNIASSEPIDDLAGPLTSLLHRSIPANVYHFSRKVYDDYQKFCIARTGVRFTLDQFAQFNYGNVKYLEQLKDKAMNNGNYIRNFLNSDESRTLCYGYASVDPTRTMQVYEKFALAIVVNRGYLPYNPDLFAHVMYEPSKTLCSKFKITISIEALMEWTKTHGEKLDKIKKFGDPKSLAALMNRSKLMKFCTEVEALHSIQKVSGYEELLQSKILD